MRTSVGMRKANAFAVGLLLTVGYVVRANASTTEDKDDNNFREDVILCVLNFTPVPRIGYRVGVPGPGSWSEVLNTDAGVYGGSNVGNSGGVFAELVPMHNQKYSVLLNLPPLGAVFFKGKV